MKHFGRLSNVQAAAFGKNLTHGIGYISVGPIAILFNLPKRFWLVEQDAPLFDLNAHLRSIGKL